MRCEHLGQGQETRRGGRLDRDRDRWLILRTVGEGRVGHNEAQRRGTCERLHLRRCVVRKNILRWVGIRGGESFNSGDAANRGSVTRYYFEPLLV